MARRGGGRSLHVKVRSARGRRTSSTRWLNRQLNDPYVSEARSAGYRSRAAFKLAELDDRYKFLKPGARVLDLGAAPGGWSQVAAERVAGGSGGGAVFAADLTPIDPLPGVTVLELDMTDAASTEALAEALGGKADAVLSDMAAPATGHRQTDHLRVMALAEAAWAVAAELLAPGGTFLAKVLQGGTERTLLDELRRHFTSVRHAKPPASRSDSKEIYVLAMGYRGTD